MINRVIRQLVLYDVTVQFAFGLLSPIFAVFILKNIQGSSLAVVGLAATSYWIARVLTTIPLSRLMDKTDGERDEFYFAVIGAFIVASIPLLYLLAREPWHVYLIQFIFGLANSMAVPAWRILFVDHLDKGKTGFAWSLDDVGLGIAIAGSAYIGSIMADKFGFTVVLVIASIIGYFAAIMLIPLHRDAKSLKQLQRQKKPITIKAVPSLLMPRQSSFKRTDGVQ